MRILACLCAFVLAGCATANDPPARPGAVYGCTARAWATDGAGDARPALCARVMGTVNAQKEARR